MAAGTSSAIRLRRGPRSQARCGSCCERELRPRSLVAHFVEGPCARGGMGLSILIDRQQSTIGAILITC
jgi:hypothetical protein